ncbi:MAG: Omp28 family outer membrane lipoprotein [Bacteroidetes bacterium]|nr:Omp28 family outer membrane lipoprotein [Bacteroidota bacterium]
MKYKNNYIYFIIFISFVFFMYSCDKINGPFVENNNEDTTNFSVTNFPEDNVHTRIILLEEFTGHMCGNCPEAIETYESLKQIYKEQLVTYSPHVGWFASVGVYPNYTYDYRNITATDISDYFGNDAAGLPNGMINRKDFGAGLILQHTNWGSNLQKIINTPPEIDINIINEYDEADRKLSTHIQSMILNDIQGTCNLAVYIIEDSIASYQKDYNSTPDDIPNFVHRHVLRDAINGTWGTIISSGIAHADTSIIKSYNYQINTNWDINQCSIVAFVYKDDTKEILQVGVKHIIE